jgi:protein SCO1/2
MRILQPALPLRKAGAACLWLLAALCIQPAVLHAAPAAPAAAVGANAALRASQAAVGRTIGDYTLLDRQGRPVTLSSFRGKPLLVSFIYTGCFQVCPLTTRSLDEAVQALQARFGDGQFNVVSIGFNQPADSPQAMKAFAAQHRISRPNWDFLSPPQRIVPELTRDFGFVYEATPAGFDHVLQVSLVDGNGRLVRQVYGDRVPADALGEPMKDLLLGAPLPQQASIADIVDKVRLLCTVYDPRTGTYRVDYGRAMEVGGGVMFIVAMLVFMLGEWRSHRRARRAARQA